MKSLPMRPARAASAVLLALAIAMAGLPGVGRAGDDNDNNRERGRQTSDKPASDKPVSTTPTGSPQTLSPSGAAPDLELTYGGFKSPDNVRVITFAVKNVGMAPSSVTAKVRVVTSTPEPTPHFREIPLPPKVGTLKPGESGVLQPGESAEVIYLLAADCDGHVVRGLVNDPLDTNTANNFAEVTVCPAAPPPDDGAVVVGPAPRAIPVPEYLRPGSRHMVLEPSLIRSDYRDHFFEPGGCGPYRYGSPHAHVGWVQDERNTSILGVEFRDCAYVGEAVLYVDFPYELLDGIRSEWISRASLSFNEHEQVWLGDDGRTGCVTTISFGPRPYLSGPDSQLAFPVTEAVREQVSKSPGQRLGWAFGLRGALTLGDLRAEGSSSCLSYLDNIQLFVAYDVPT